MIRLLDLLMEEEDRDYVSKSHPPMTIWQTPEHQWGATDTYGVVRYHNSREDAIAFAMGQGKESPHPGRPETTKKRSRKVDKQNDDRADID